MTTEQPTPPAVVLSTAQLERIDDLAKWFTDNPNHRDIKDGLTVLVRDVAFAEREACAAECERMMMFPGGRQESFAHHGVHEAAKAIRERSNAMYTAKPAL